jgi:hypothetical protein
MGFLSFFKKYLVESSLARIWQHFENEDIPVGIITAFRKKFTLPENRQRNKRLIADLKTYGLGFIPVNGGYPETDDTTGEKHNVREESLVVIGSAGDNGELKNVLSTLAKKYDQESALYKEVGEKRNAYLLFPNKSTSPLGTIKYNKMSDYMSKLKGGRESFVFESVGKEYPSTKNKPYWVMGVEAQKKVL